MWLLKEALEQERALMLFGACNVLFGLLLFALRGIVKMKVNGENAFNKPVKFAWSIGILSITMACYISAYRGEQSFVWARWIFILSMLFEIVYIAIQAFRGQASHFNVSTKVYSFLYSTMAIGASAGTLAMGYIGLSYCTHPPLGLSNAMLWACRMGVLTFVVFAFQGFIMGARLSHSVGKAEADAPKGILGWSRTVGDLRIAHFLGMHALQIFPLFAAYVSESIVAIILFMAVYITTTIYALRNALRGRPYFK